MPTPTSNGSKITSRIPIYLCCLPKDWTRIKRHHQRKINLRAFTPCEGLALEEPLIQEGKSQQFPKWWQVFLCSLEEKTHSKRGMKRYILNIWERSFISFSLCSHHSLWPSDCPSYSPLPPASPALTSASSTAQRTWTSLPIILSSLVPFLLTSFFFVLFHCFFSLLPLLFPFFCFSFKI